MLTGDVGFSSTGSLFNLSHVRQTARNTESSPLQLFHRTNIQLREWTGQELSPHCSSQSMKCPTHTAARHSTHLL